MSWFGITQVFLLQAQYGNPANGLVKFVVGLFVRPIKELIYFCFESAFSLTKL